MQFHSQDLGFWTPGPMELIIILIIAVLLFGRKLPEIARSIGKSLTEFKRGVNEAKDIQDDFADDVRRTRDDLNRQIDDAAAAKKPEAANSPDD